MKNQFIQVFEPWATIRDIFDIVLKSERARLKITQAEAAEILDVSTSVIRQWESKRRTPLAITAEGAIERLRKHKK